MSRVPPPGPQREAWKRKMKRFASPLLAVVLHEGWEVPVDEEGVERFDWLPAEAFIDGVHPFAELIAANATTQNKTSPGPMSVAAQEEVHQFLAESGEAEDLLRAIGQTSAFWEWKRRRGRGSRDADAK